jgi:serine/threonine-protein kinase mTOR
VVLKESWYEKLERWEEALQAYERKQLEDPLNPDVTLGRMRCLAGLGEWERLAALSADTWRTANEELRFSVGPLATLASWNLGRWDDMAEYSRAIDDTKTEVRRLFERFCCFAWLDMC